MNFRMEGLASTELAEKLEKQIAGIDRIRKINSYGLISPETDAALASVRDRAEALRRKFRTGEYEIAVVGLEKAGKSTFANALMGNDILPAKPLRCTYTTTSVRWAEEDRAEITFFGAERFIEAFRANLRKMGIPHADTLTPASLSLEDYRREFDKLGEETKSYYRNSVNEDIETILKNYSSTLGRYIGAPPLLVSGAERISAPEFRRFIEIPEYAIAVREITVYSSKLDRMRNAVIYDVPGFDSPTEMHKSQTRDKMRRSDAILLVTNAETPSFNGPSLDMFRTVTDDDGLTLGDKLFVFANRADTVENLPANLEDLKNELLRYRMMPKSHFGRVVPGSAKGRLQALGVLPGQDVANALKSKGRSDGVKEIYEKLAEYNRTERAKVLERRAGKVESDIRRIFEELFQGQEESASGFCRARDSLTLEKFTSAQNAIKALLEGYRTDLNEKFSREKRPLTNKLLAEVVKKIDSAGELGVTDEEMERYGKGIEVPVQNPTAVDVELRKDKRPRIYDAFRKGVVNLAEEERRACESRIEELMLKGIGVFPQSDTGGELRKRVRGYIESVKGEISGRGYYDSLIFRFSDDIFNILLQFPFGDMARFNYFDKNRDIFYSLSMFDRDADPSKPPEEQPLLYQLLFHRVPDHAGNAPGADADRKVLDAALSLAESYVMEPPEGRLKRLIAAYARENQNDALPQMKEAIQSLLASRLQTSREERKRLLADWIEFEVEADVGEDDADVKPEPREKRLPHDENWYKAQFRDRPSPTYDTVKADLNADIDILRGVLENAVVPAVCIETPFLSLERALIRNILEDIERGKGFQDFLSENMPLIAAEEYRILDEREQKRNVQKAIRMEIRDILKEMNGEGSL
ncbi:MAG: dynamin family protein [Oscillibacter sp.]|nr:dynamin family protein [Oscillibacter sp.]